jgi:hypothetical protein
MSVLKLMGVMELLSLLVISDELSWRSKLAAEVKQSSKAR